MKLNGVMCMAVGFGLAYLMRNVESAGGVFGVLLGLGGLFALLEGFQREVIENVVEGLLKEEKLRDAERRRR